MVGMVKNIRLRNFSFQINGPNSSKISIRLHQNCIPMKSSCYRKCRRAFAGLSRFAVRGFLLARKMNERVQTISVLTQHTYLCTQLFERTSSVGVYENLALRSRARIQRESGNYYSGFCFGLIWNVHYKLCCIFW